jgi:hypothetical protein
MSAQPGDRVTTAGWRLLARAGVLLVCIALIPLSEPQLAPRAGQRSGEEVQPEKGSILISFEEHKVESNTAAVLKVLTDLGLVAVKDHVVSGSETACGILVTGLSLPRECSVPLQDFARRLNPRIRSLHRLIPGMVLRIPEVSFERYEYVRPFDTRSKQDSEDLADFRARSAADIVKVQKKDNLHVLYAATGYRLRIPVEDRAVVAKIRAALKDRLGEFLFVEFSTAESPKTGPDFNTVAGDGITDMVEAWCLDAIKPEIDYFNLMNTTSGNTLSAVNCSDGHCPSIVLIDTAVHPHRELAGSLGLTTTSGGRTAPASCVPFDEPQHHGTLMAGLMVAVRDGMGIAGINPSASLTSWQWNPNDLAGLGSNLVSAEQSADRSVITFASSWKYAEPPTNRAARFTNSLAKRIRDSLNLWVVAAGDSGRNTGLQITELFPSGPMNLGDQSHVLVVTGCSSCYRPDFATKRLPAANYSCNGMVHVAAPADRMIGLGTQLEYVKTVGGTSSATAFVASLASLMMRQYFYNSVADVKTRLQYTAHPMTVDTEACDGVPEIKGGAVDAEAALLDPRKDYMKVESGWKEMPIDAWCSKADGTAGLTLLDEDKQNAAEIPASHVLRIVRRKVGPDAVQWFVFARGKSLGEVVRYGPQSQLVVLTANARVGQRPLLVARGRETPVLVDEIGDLLLASRPKGVQRCQAN